MSDFVFQIKRFKSRQIPLTRIETDKNGKLAVALLSLIKKCPVLVSNFLFNSVLLTRLFFNKHFAGSDDAFDHLTFFVRVTISSAGDGHRMLCNTVCSLQSFNTLTKKAVYH